MRQHSFISGIFFPTFQDSAFAMQPLVEKILEQENNTCLTATQLIRKWKTQETLARHPRSLVYDTAHCTENLKQIFSEMKLRGLFPNFYIPVSVRDLYISMIILPIFLYCVCEPILKISK
jgi:hypothetical protein